MLETVAQPFLMDNPPDDMKKRFLKEKQMHTVYGCICFYIFTFYEPIFDYLSRFMNFT